MRRIIKYLFILSIGFVAGYLLVHIINRYSEKKEAEIRIQTLPDVAFVSLAGLPVNLKSFDQSKPLVLVYFHPECEHCQYEAQEIGQNAVTFSNCQLIMITQDDSLQRVKSFCETNHLWEVDNIEVLIDSDNQFKKVFGKAVIPSVYIYGTNRKLKKQFLGETRIDLILAEISAIK
jgi:peroxiredoxin